MFATIKNFVSKTITSVMDTARSLAASIANAAVVTATVVKETASVALNAIATVGAVLVLVTGMLLIASHPFIAIIVIAGTLCAMCDSWVPVAVVTAAATAFVAVELLTFVLAAMIGVVEILVVMVIVAGLAAACTSSAKTCWA